MSNKTGTQAPSQSKTAQMLEGFMALWNKGYDISRIAGEFGLSPSVVYRQLDKIAEREGLPGREYFLTGKKGTKHHIRTNQEPDGVASKNESGENPGTIPAPTDNKTPGTDAASTLFDAAISGLEGLISGVQQVVRAYATQPNIGGKSNE